MSGDQDPDVTRRRAETFQLIATEVKERKLDISLLLSRLRTVGASPEEAKDYFEQAKQHLTSG
jgi:parvulin-like peptidyl-prolyl isomerase